MKTTFARLAASQLALAVALFAGAASAETLTLYTSQPEADATKTVEAFKKVHPDVDVQVYRSGTSDILAKLAAEFAANSPQPDVLLIADAVSMELLKKDSRLMAYAEAKLDGFAADSYDADKTYFGSKLITTGIAYNTAAAEKPEHWADLAKPAYADGLVMPSPLYSGAAAYLLSAFTGNVDYGWDYFDKLKANNTISVRGNGAVLKSVASGEKPYGILVDFMAMNAKAKGSPVEFVFPSEGVPAVTEPVAILSTAKNVAGAKQFVDFILSDDGQKLALEQGYLPAKPSVGRPAWLPEGVEVKVMNFDVKAIVEKIEADKAKFSGLFGG
ncbi:ABC transporter substrate-binding protein [Aminobacter sp. MDW-2]|uniref:ABC transporter substrate-binding protein n=1 Tax=Aminobacter sp. MDW-2 TaxID=2666139 RepID=UPI0012B0914F|nr:ABC transporter substrate-binding protein [Aminobacter sp. MDW-2]MRX32399.1 extracellular solute-binding protein [Aminobacter sp. MDW-2]QNH37775.1 ABC transporter substrate-binding protein [Aminobacter sp. MDW-2]